MGALSEFEAEPREAQVPAFPNADSVSLKCQPHQTKLLEALEEEGKQYREFYSGALLLAQNKSPECWRILAAHCLREIVEKLAEYSSLQGLPTPFKTNNEVQKLSDRWQNLLSNSRWPGKKGEEWTGTIDGVLKGFIVACDDVLKRFAERFVRRNLQAEHMFEKFNLADRPLPNPLRRAKTDYWFIYRDYFTDLAHRKFDRANPDEFEDYFAQFEIDLLNLLRPQNSEIQKAIDLIVREAEGNG